jgi:hypothetical protein
MNSSDGVTDRHVPAKLSGECETASVDRDEHPIEAARRMIVAEVRLVMTCSARCNSEYSAIGNPVTACSLREALRDRDGRVLGYLGRGAATSIADAVPVEEFQVKRVQRTGSDSDGSDGRPRTDPPGYERIRDRSTRSQHEAAEAIRRNRNDAGRDLSEARKWGMQGDARTPQPSTGPCFDHCADDDAGVRSRQLYGRKHSADAFPCA